MHQLSLPESHFRPLPDSNPDPTPRPLNHPLLTHHPPTQYPMLIWAIYTLFPAYPASVPVWFVGVCVGMGDSRLCAALWDVL